VVFADIRGFELVLSLCFSHLCFLAWLDRSSFIVRTTALGGGFELVWCLLSSVHWIEKWLHGDSRAWL